jgi:4'-phosphopantetheinyl transferase
MQALLQKLPVCPSLMPNRAHVWQANLNLPENVLAELQTFLTSEELSRAGKFLLPQARRQFIISRGLLKYFVGNYLEIPPAKVQFAQNTYGKPFVNNLEFNLSHSNDLVLLAFSHSRPIGVDIEQVRSNLDYEGIARKNFSQAENKILHSLSGTPKLRAFFEIWTMKEACIKAVGKGLSIPLTHFGVSLAQVQTVQLEQLWTVQKLSLGADYCGAIAVAGRNWNLDYFYL